MKVAVINHDRAANLTAGALVLPRGEVRYYEMEAVADARKSEVFRKWEEEGRVEVLTPGKEYKGLDTENAPDQHDFGTEEIAKELYRRRHEALLNRDEFDLHFRSLLANGMTHSEAIEYMSKYYGVSADEVRRRVE